MDGKNQFNPPFTIPIEDDQGNVHVFEGCHIKSVEYNYPTDGSIIVEEAVVMSYLVPPLYGRKKVDELIKKIADEAEHAVKNGVDPVTISMPASDVRILANMLWEMDKHLPDFFEGEE